MTMEWLKEIEEIEKFLVDVRRDFHAYPELGLEEYRTRDQICQYLKIMEIPYEIIAKTGVVGLIKGKYPGKTVALRADMDALPIFEENQVPYKSQHEGKMHACGHDAHMTILLGVAKIIGAHRNQLKGQVKLLFQPAEETVGGAKPMIDEGVMNNPKVDTVLGLHVTPELQVGEIGIRYDQMSASSDTLTIDIYGESTHGAYPHSGTDSILIAGHVVTAIQSIVSRNVDPRESGVISLGTIHGGTQGNIIANHVQMVGTIRTLNHKVRDIILDRIVKVIKATCEALGGRGEVTLEPGYPHLINHKEVVDSVKEVGEEILALDQVVDIKSASLGVEDFGYFLFEAPGAYFKLGCGNLEKGIVHDGHHPLFDIDEECLQIGVKMMVGMILNLLEM